MSLKYEPSSEPLHISAKYLDGAVDLDAFRRVELTVGVVQILGT